MLLTSLLDEKLNHFEREGLILKPVSERSYIVAFNRFLMTGKAKGDIFISRLRRNNLHQSVMVDIVTKSPEGKYNANLTIQNIRELIDSHINSRCAMTDASIKKAMSMSPEEVKMKALLISSANVSDEGVSRMKGRTYWRIKFLTKEELDLLERFIAIFSKSVRRDSISIPITDMLSIELNAYLEKLLEVAIGSQQYVEKQIFESHIYNGVQFLAQVDNVDVFHFTSINPTCDYKFVKSFVFWNFLQDTFNRLSDCYAMQLNRTELLMNFINYYLEKNLSRIHKED